jgi:hypothetical protein
MSWLERTQAHNADGIACFESRAGAAGVYNLTTTWPGTCNVLNLYAMMAFRPAGTWSYVKSNSSASPDERPGGIATYDLPYTGGNSGGDLLIACVAFNTGFSTAACTMTDTAGNDWIPILGAAVSSGGGARFGVFVVANAKAALSNTVTFAAVGAGGVFLDITASVFEYSNLSTTPPTFYPFPPGSPSGANPLAWGGVGAPYVSPTGVCDAVSSNSGPAVNMFTDHLTTSVPGDLLLVFTANLPYCGGVVLTGGGPNPEGSGEVHGTFTGFIAQGQIGGGTK